MLTLNTSTTTCNTTPVQKVDICKFTDDMQFSLYFFVNINQTYRLLTMLLFEIIKLLKLYIDWLVVIIWTKFVNEVFKQQV